MLANFGAVYIDNQLPTGHHLKNEQQLTDARRPLVFRLDNGFQAYGSIGK
jgi:hypothetical protein